MIVCEYGGGGGVSWQQCVKQLIAEGGGSQRATADGLFLWLIESANYSYDMRWLGDDS